MPSPIEPRNFLDRALEAVAPQLANRRYAARASLQAARDYMNGRGGGGQCGGPYASYGGAVATRSGTQWNHSISYRGGTTAERHDLWDMSSRADRVYRENVIARSMLDTETDNVVAEGYSLQMLTKTTAFNGEAEDRFYRWLDKADISGKHSGADLFRMTWREPRKKGDGGLVLISRGGYPYLQYIPGDLIRNPYKGFDYRTMFDGVEVDPAGRPVRYWIRDIAETGQDEINPVDARDFVNWAFLDDPLAVRGSTVYGPIFGELDELDGYRGAVTIAARLGAMFGLVEKRANPAAATNILGTTTNSQGDQQKVVSMENGMIKIHGEKDSIYQINATQPMVNSPDFIRACMRIIALRFDMPIEIAGKDLSQVNFSGGRIGLISYYRSCRVKQDFHLHGWRRIVFWWLSKERQRQQLGYGDAFKTPFPEDFGTFQLHGREWDYNDPETEAKADLLEISLGTKTAKMACEQKGRDYEAIRTQRKKELDDDRRDGIPVVLSTATRDEKTAVTAVDANGNPMTPSEDGADLAFKRTVVSAFLADKTVNDVIYNVTDVARLLEDVGLPLDKKVQTNPDQGVPLLPVIAENGQLVTGDAIYDPQGDLVGGDVASGRVADPAAEAAVAAAAATAASATSIEKLAEAVTHQTGEVVAAIAKQPPPQVHVTTPVSVQPSPPAAVSIPITVQPAAVSVTPPAVHVAGPVIHLPATAKTKNIIRNGDGEITKITES